MENVTPSVLHQYLARERVPWSRVVERLQTSPDEANDSDIYGRVFLNAILSRHTMEDYPSAEVVKAFIEAYPPPIWWVGSTALGISRMPLEVACNRRAPLDVLKQLMDSRPSMPDDIVALETLWRAHSNMLERQGINLVDFVCEGGREGVRIWTKLYMMLRYCTDPRKNASAWLGLHLACSTPTCPLELFKLILDMYSHDETKQTNRQGQLPLHCLASRTNQRFWKEKVDLLLEAYPEAVWVSDSEGLLPIHAAVLAGHKQEFVDLLVQAAPETLCCRGGNGNLFPFQMAASSSLDSSSLTYHLLRSAPHLLAENAFQDGRQLENGLNIVPSVSSDVERHRTRSFIDTVDSVTWSGYSSGMCNEMLELLSSHEGYTDAVWTVVHAASSVANLDPDFLELAVRLHPQDVRRKDDNGRLPLHIVSSLDAHHLDNSEETDERQVKKINIVLQPYLGAARVRDKSNSLPLHKAVVAGMSWSSLSLLIRAAPETLCRRDGVFKLYPFQLAASSHLAGLNEVFQLLLSSPHVLFQQNMM